MTDRQWSRLTYLAAGTVAACFVVRAAWLTYRVTRLSATIAALRTALDVPGVAHEGLQLMALRDARTLAWGMVLVAPAAVVLIARLARNITRYP